MNTASHLGDAVAVGIAQQGDAVGARHRAPALLHEQAINQPSMPLAIIRLLGGALVSATSTSPGEH